MPKDTIGDVDLQWIETLIKFIFSWVILMPVAVIVTGKLLSKPINYGADSKQLLKIPLRIFNVEASGGEVILGFACLFIVFLSVAMIGGADVHTVVKTKFGVDPGQFHSIVFFSSLLSVSISGALFIIHYVFKQCSSSTFVDKDKYNEMIEKLANGGDK